MRSAAKIESDKRRYQAKRDESVCVQCGKEDTHDAAMCIKCARRCNDCRNARRALAKAALAT